MYTYIIIVVLSGCLKESEHGINHLNFAYSSMQYVRCAVTSDDLLVSFAVVLMKNSKAVVLSGFNNCFHQEL